MEVSEDAAGNKAEIRMRISLYLPAARMGRVIVISKSERVREFMQ